MNHYCRDPTSHTARKAHQCVACHALIPVGERYVQQTGIYEDRAFRSRYHSECWDMVIDSGDDEFTPGEFDPPERLRAEPAAVEGSNG